MPSCGTEFGRLWAPGVTLHVVLMAMWLPLCTYLLQLQAAQHRESNKWEGEKEGTHQIFALEPGVSSSMIKLKSQTESYGT
jgi:hypothetical protein